MPLGTDLGMVERCDAHHASRVAADIASGTDLGMMGRCDVSGGCVAADMSVWVCWEGSTDSVGDSDGGDACLYLTRE